MYDLLSITLKERVCERVFLGPIWCFVNGYHDNNLKSNSHVQVRKIKDDEIRSTTSQRSHGWRLMWAWQLINLVAQSHILIDSFEGMDKKTMVFLR